MSIEADLEWRIWTESAPIAEPSRWDELADGYLDALVEDERALGPVGHGRVGVNFGAVFIVEAANIGDGVMLGLEIMHQALNRLGSDPVMEQIQIAPADWEPTAWIGASAVAELIGVSRQRVYQLMERPDFPRPARDGDRGKLWDREAIEDWARVQRPAGRPRAASGA